MKQDKTVRWIWLSLTLLLILGACRSAPRSGVTFHDPDMDFSLVQTVAVMPFQNLSTFPKAAEQVRDSFMIMLQATGAMYVLPPGEVTRGIQRVGVLDPAAPTPEEVTSLARIVSADVIITGTVREFGQMRSGSTAGNVVSVSVEMLEAETGRIVWSAASTRGGVTTGARVFGGGGRPMDIVVTRAVNDLLDQLFR
jgi:hypothetical protein